VKISETIKALFRRQPPRTTRELAAPTEAERRREHEAFLATRIEAEKLRPLNDLFPPF
jgi:hypothetical protein